MQCCERSNGTVKGQPRHVEWPLGHLSPLLVPLPSHPQCMETWQKLRAWTGEGKQETPRPGTP